MILCPNCKASQVEGTIFCGDCGARLVTPEPQATQTIRRGSTDRLTIQTDPLPAHTGHTGSLMQPGEVNLLLVEAGKMITAPAKTDFTLGRIIEGQANRPDIDLTPYDGYGQGVSRLHAVIRQSGPHATITDLGSSNGTRVNGQKIAPQVDYPISHGDVIALGKLKIQIMIRKRTSSLQ